MSFFLRSAVKDLQRYLRDPFALLLWVGIPLVIGGLITLATGGTGGPSPRATLLVTDADESFLSRLFVGALSQTGGLIDVEKTDEGPARERVGAGKASAWLSIPEGFTEGVLREEPIRLELKTNPSQRVLPGIIEEALDIFAEATFYVHRLIGERLKEFSEGKPSDEQVAEFSIEMNRLGERMERYLFPPRIQITAVEKPGEEDQPAYGILFLPGILFMSLIFMAQGLSEDLWREKHLHTLRRVAMAPHSLIAFFGGKLLAGTALMILVICVGLFMGYAYFDLGWRSFPTAVVFSAAAGALILALMAAIQLHASSQRAGGILTMTLIFPLMMVGGSFFPFEAMPAWMARIGRATPNGQGVEQLKSILLQRAETGSSAAAIAAMLLLCGALLAFAARRMKARFVHG